MLVLVLVLVLVLAAAAAAVAHGHDREVLDGQPRGELGGGTLGGIYGPGRVCFPFVLQITSGGRQLKQHHAKTEITP